MAFIDMESKRTVTDFWAFIQRQVFASAFIVCPLCFLQVFKYCFCCSYFVSTWVSAGASVCRNRGWGRSRVTWVTLGFCPIIGWSIWCGTVIHTATSQFLGWCCLTFLVYHRGSRSCDVPNHNQSRFWVDMSWFKQGSLEQVFTDKR